MAGALALLLFVALGTRTLLQLARAPEANWDMLPAMALALEWEERDPVELHRRTYERARAELPAATYAELTSGGVRLARAQDPRAFHEHLAFYRARILYSFAVWVLFRLGAPLSAATYWVPLGCWTLLALLALAWSARHLPLALAALFALGLAHTPALLNQAGTSSADALATLLTCLAAWFLVERRAFLPAAGFLLAAIAARPDAVILLAFLAVALLLLVPEGERPRPGTLAVLLGLGAALCLGLQRYAGEYGWWPLIQISFVEKALHPSGLPTAVDWSEYGSILARQVGALPGEGYTTTPAGEEVTGSTLVFLYAVLAVIGISFAWPRERAERRIAALFAALLAAYLLRFLLFPQTWDRFFAPLYALVPLGWLSLAAPRLRDASQRELA